MAQKHAPSPWDSLRERIRAHRPDSCSVYGFGPDAQAMLKLLGKDGIHGNMRRPGKTGYHAVLLDNDRETLDFYKEHFAQMTTGRIALALESTADFTAPQDNVHAFSLSEVASTLFWGSYPARSDEKIAFIGDDPLLSNLLRQGLCLNIFLPAQSIQYHIWGAEQTTGILPGISQITMDKIVLHHRPWQEEQTVLAGMDRIVLCDTQEKNLAVYSQLGEMRSCPSIYLYGDDAPQKATSPRGKVTAFGAREDTLRREIVLEEALLREAKALNDYYRKEYGGEPWERLEPFKRMSSISSAGYFPVLRRLFKAGIPMETLSELEHIRWNRFHYLQGWQYAPERDNEKKYHNCLVPYSQLSEEEKQKDRNNVMLALGQKL